MKTRNIDGIIEKIACVVDSHKLEGEGEYARWIWQCTKNNRQLGMNEYGCADAANILYSIGKFEGAPEKRASWIKALQSMQDPESGLFTEETHSAFHTTAHCLAALELFDAKPLYPIRAVEKCKEIDTLYAFLNGLDWKHKPWPQSHGGAGIFAIMNLSEMADYEWNEAYFKWLWEHTDEETGLIGRTGSPDETARKYEYMAGTFHYLFNMEYARMPLRYPEKLIDTCLWMYKNRANGELRFSSSFGRQIDFIQVDWIYCITRALRQTGYKYAECMAALEDFAEQFLDYLEEVDEQKEDRFNDLHLLFGAVCALAELQQALKGKLRSSKPLKLVLDRRPFI